jgi:Ca2+-binding RTX toxin-like protein
MVQLVTTTNVVTAGNAIDLAASDTLFVTAIGTLTSQNGAGVLADGGSNRVTVAGHIAANTTAVALGDVDGAATSGRAALTVLDGATIGSNGIGVSLSGEQNSVVNGGTIAARRGISAGFFDANDATDARIVNTGSILCQEVGLLLADFDGDVTNSGTIASSDDSGSASFGAVGEALGGICASGTGLRIANTGTITAASDRGYGIAVAGSGTQVVNGGLVQTNSTVADRAAIDLITALGEAAVLTNTATGRVVSTLTAVQGGAGNERVRNAGEIVGNVELGAGNDRYDGRGGGVDGFVFTGSGTDVLIGGARDDDLRGSHDNDALNGWDGNDRLDGGLGNDTIAGGDGDDRLIGDNGNDVLNGGAGDDILAGGRGIDRFVFRRGHGDDTVAAFQNGLDRADLRAFGFASFAAVQARASAEPGGVRLDLTGVDGGTVFLDDLLLAQFNAADVLL